MILEVVEHQKIFIGKHNDQKKCQISKSDAYYLMNLENKQGKQIFRWGSYYLTPQHWVGIIKTPDVTLEILPKITDNINKSLIRKSLVKMIETTSDIPVRRNIEANISYGGQGFIDVLASIFLQELNLQIKFGLTKSYGKVENNLYTVKGKIDFPKHIRKNTFLKNKFYCSYSVLTEDNLLNQVIKYTLHILKGSVKRRKNIDLINKLLFYFGDVKLREVTQQEVYSIKLDRKSIHYKNILEYCKMFIGKQSIDMKAGKLNINLMLFDMNRLFEEFIFKMYKKVHSGAHRYEFQYLLSGLNDGKQKLRLEPDIILNTSKERIIIDTKWKQIKGFAEESDAYQMNAYLNAFPNVSKAILLYPKTDNNDKVTGSYEFINQNQSLQLRIATVDLTKLENRQAFFDSLLNIIE